MMLRLCFLITLFFSIAWPQLLLSQELDRPAELVVHLLDYLAKDYAGAVRNGNVVSSSEYAEQLEFAGLVQKNTGRSSALNSNPAFRESVQKLLGLIEKKEDERRVAKIARELQKEAIRLSGIAIAPTSWPDLSSGEVLFKENCASCHGMDGRGDGPAGHALKPKPANFHDSDLMWSSSPYQFYNTIRLGVPDTAMNGFTRFSDGEVWALAFYLKALPHANMKERPSSLRKISLSEMASLTDEELSEKLKDEGDVPLMLATLRTHRGDSDPQNPFSLATELIEQSVRVAEHADYAEAEHLAIRGYLEGIEPLEPKIRANRPEAVEELEVKMAALRSAYSRKSTLKEIERATASVLVVLEKIGNSFDRQKMSHEVAFIAAFSIFLREGFEAVLIIIVLLSIVHAMNRPDAVKWIHFGWISGVGLGLVAWFASGILVKMSGVNREVLEGLMSLLAVTVLLYVGFWLHRYSEAKKWKAYLEAMLKDRLSNKSRILLASVSFIAVFREAIEVVLFLRAIWLDLEPAGQRVAGTGVISSLGLLFAVSYFAVRECHRLPISLLFRICSWTMLILAVILAGKGTQSMQEAGIVSVSGLSSWLRLDLLGIYPSMQTLCAQAIVIIVFLSLFVSDRYKSATAGIVSSNK